MEESFPFISFESDEGGSNLLIVYVDGSALFLSVEVVGTIISFGGILLGEG